VKGIFILFETKTMLKAIFFDIARKDKVPEVDKGCTEYANYIPCNLG
jgi:hypothetical protein